MSEIDLDKNPPIVEQPKYPKRYKVSKVVEEEIKNRVEEALAKAMRAPGLNACEIEVPTLANDVLDTEQIFQLYAIYCGDAKRTALASGQSEDSIVKLAESQGWKEKIKLLIDLRTSARPGDSERGINRAINFVQAHRLRNVLQSVIQKLSALSNRELADLLLAVDVDRNGNVSRKIVTRAFADLASALEKCHAMTYSALNDTVGERRERSDTPAQEKSTAELHWQITKAMEDVRLSSQQVNNPITPLATTETNEETT